MRSSRISQGEEWRTRFMTTAHMANLKMASTYLVASLLYRQEPYQLPMLAKIGEEFSKISWGKIGMLLHATWTCGACKPHDTLKCNSPLATYLGRQGPNRRVGKQDTGPQKQVKITSFRACRTKPALVQPCEGIARIDKL